MRQRPVARWPALLLLAASSGCSMLELGAAQLALINDQQPLPAALLREPVEPFAAIRSRRLLGRVLAVGQEVVRMPVG